MSSRPTLLGVVATLLLAGAPCAWPLSTGTFPADNTRVLPLPAAVQQAGNVSVMALGDFTGDHVLDAALLAGSTPFLIYGPALYNEVYPWSDQVVDLAAFHNPSAEVPDALAVLTGAGVEILSGYGGVSIFQDRLPVADHRWVGARCVKTADLDGDGDTDLIGLTGDGLSVLLTFDPQSASPVQGGFPLLSEAYDLCPLDWVGDAGLEIAVVCSGGYYILTQSGNFLLNAGGNVTGGALTRFKQGSHTHDRCALLYSVLGVDFLLISDSLVVENPILLGAIGSYGLTAGELDAGGDEDLVLVHRYTHDALLFFNQAKGLPPGLLPTFDLNYAELASTGPATAPTLSQQVGPQLRDWNQDLDTDLIQYVDATSELVLLESSLIPEDAVALTLDDADYFEDEGTGLYNLTLHFSNVPSRATQVQVIAWLQTPEVDENGDLVSLGAGAASPAVLSVVAATDESGNVDVVLPLQSLDDDLDLIYNLEVRPVRQVGNAYLGAGPISLYGFAISTDIVSALAELHLSTWVTVDWDDPMHQDPPLLPPGDRQLAPALVDMLEIPLDDDSGLPPDPIPD